MARRERSVIAAGLALAAAAGAAGGAVPRPETTPTPATAADPAPAPGEAAADALAAGRARFAAGDWAGAEAAYRRGLAVLGEQVAGEPGARRLELEHGLAEALYRAGKTGESAAAARAAVALATARGDRRAEAECHTRAAAALFVLGRYTDALSSAIQAQRIADETGLAAQDAKASHLAGMVHRELQQYPEALACLRRSAERAAAAGDGALLIRAMNEEGNVLFFGGDRAGATARKREAVALARARGDEDALADCLNDLAVIAENGGDYRTARGYLEEAFAITRRLGDPRERVISAANLAGVLVFLGERERATALIDEALETALANDLPAEEEIARAALGHALYRGGDFRAAYLHVNRAYELRQERLAAESSRRTADLRALYDAERREAEIELLKRDREIQQLTLERETVRRRWWAAGFAVAALFAAALGTGWRMKVRSARALAAAKRRVEELARTDPLTGLANRRHAIERLQDEARRAQRGLGAFALVLVDLDHFKLVNDTHGHACGDHVLRHAAAVIAASVRTLDLAARWGGEEFLLLLPGTDAAGAVTVAEKVRAQLADGEVIWQGELLRVTATFGVAACAHGDVDGCLRAADAALYQGKEQGRDRVVAAA